jgi:hypothetical protein
LVHDHGKESNTWIAEEFWVKHLCYDGRILKHQIHIESIPYVRTMDEIDHIYRPIGLTLNDAINLNEDSRGASEREMQNVNKTKDTRYVNEP